MVIKISHKGWVVIPAKLRRKYALEPGMEVHVVDYGGVLALVPAADDPIDAVQNRCSVYPSIINLGEVLYITERERGLPKAQAVLTRVEGLPVEILPATRDAVLEAAHIKAQYPISYVDAFTVAAAQTMGAWILTGDMEFEAVEELVQVEWLRGGD